MKIEQALQNALGFSSIAFIEKAIEGGWLFRGKHTIERVTFDHVFPSVTLEGDYFVCLTTIHEILLDPLAWQAVGKVEGWTEVWNIGTALASQTEMTLKGVDKWQYNMHRLIDALAEEI